MSRKGKKKRKKKKDKETSGWAVHCPKCRSSGNVFAMDDESADSMLLESFMCSHCGIGFYVDSFEEEEETTSPGTSLRAILTAAEEEEEKVVRTDHPVLGELREVLV